ncbi:MAG: ADP-ribosylglycohydrolase family protein [Nitrospinaceae bacterium]|nr:ADP-ribosylglycohydrolase family protein [Nitrospinaceae bacterium]NIR55947.1 ADP-ribosylglycohydrolase family protein [Nitrospinaceae bacterium]NIS86390.1 ADP-ribosylglycohydrolase family protein [Nitrospinaceae bacterium]NIT83227.1 ADP-ribosylglycohydrolase family protein [Nitrospinaceae bacterium]NIU45433.1 ADP-ribosylglycohydrolase family protein [Nitrospinaceae bacterium]
MLGAIAGDIIGSVYEAHPIKSTDFPLFTDQSTFTDDSVLTVAVAESILHGTDYATSFKKYYNLYPHAGYGLSFIRWASSDAREPYNSWGNGSAMRVSPVGFAFDTLEEVLHEARRSAEVTHNHPEGIKGAQATAAAVFLARTGAGKKEIQTYVRDTFGYPMDEPLDSIREHYTFDISCQGTVPQAVSAFVESENFEDAVRKAVSLGGDSDTLACITGGIAQACYGALPDFIIDRVYKVLDPALRRQVTLFCNRFACV